MSQLTRTYVIALGALGAAIAATYVMLRMLAIAHAGDVSALQVNLRQIERAQQIARVAMELDEAAAAAADRFATLRSTLATTAAALEVANLRVTRPRNGQQPPARANPALSLIYFHPEAGVDILVQGVLFEIENLSLRDGVAQIADRLKTEALALRKRLAAADDAHRAVAETSARLFASSATGAALGILGLALGLGIFLFRPVAQREAARTERLETLNAKARHNAMHDPLTGLPNRRYLQDYLGRCLAANARSGGNVAALHVDLDRFKTVNDTMGHAAGDRLLRQAARIMRSEIRNGDFLARVGGDEFVIVVSDAERIDDLVGMADRLIERLCEPLPIDRDHVRVGASVGIAISDPQTEAAGPDRLLMNADIALYDAKNSGRGRFVMFSDGRREEFEERQRIASELREALAADQIEPWFQPQICVRTGKVSGFESLVRWRHPERGVLTPFHFLAIAEDTGLIGGIGEVMIRKSLSALAVWRSMGLNVERIGLNISARELRDAGFVDKLAWDVDAAGLSPQNVAVEILETVLIDDDNDPVIRNVSALASAGYSVELDDFGTGHASISNLMKFQVHKLKIDRSFITNIDRLPEQQKIARAIINLAHSLDVSVLAEGVETEAEQQMLEQLGSDYLQGYRLGRPMTEAATLKWLLKHVDKQPGAQSEPTAPASGAS